MLGHRPDAEETDRALTALSHACRRRLLFELYEEGNSGAEASIKYTSIARFGTETRRALLYHIHLPKLEEWGYIEWNEAEQTIRKGDQWEEVEPLLKLINTYLREFPPG